MASTMMRVERVLNPDLSRVCIPNTQDVHYKIAGDPVTVKKYIALVLDCSEGMGYYKLDGAKTRLDVMKESASRLIQKFTNSPETQICIFAYSDNAYALTELLQVDGDNNKDNAAALINVINSLSSRQNSNLGDGMRKAYWKLKNLPSDGLKCMILMNAGEPNMFTTVSEHLYHDFETMEGNIDYLIKDGEGNHVYADYQSAVRYGLEIAKWIAAEKINTFAVGLNSEESYKLEAIAAACKAGTTADGKHYYHVPGLKDIDYMCDGILNKIQADIPLKVSFSEIIPKGVDIISVPEGFQSILQSDGSYRVSGEIDGITLSKIDNNGDFTIKPWEGIIKVKYATEGNKDFNAIELRYIDPYANSHLAQIADSISVYAYLDVIPPVTVCALNGKKSANEWYSSDITVTLTASDSPDGSGVAKTEYHFEGADWQEYTSPFIVTYEGITAVYFRSSDIAGNIEAEKNVMLYIDKTPPITTCSFVGTKGKLDGWFTSDVKVVLTASDPNTSNSGIAKIQYRFEGMTWQDYTAPAMVSSEGKTDIFYRSLDNVGNIEAEKSAVLYVDKTGPVLTPPTDINYMASGDYVRLSSIGEAAAVDALSGVESIASIPSELFHAGVTQVIWKAVDLNGNVSTETQSVTIQTPPPSFEYSYGVIRVNQSDFKIWFIPNGFIPGNLTVRYKLRGGTNTESTMGYSNGIWEYELKGLSNTVLEYSFSYTKDMDHKENTPTNVYEVTGDVAIDSEYTENVVNLSPSEAKILFNTIGVSKSVEVIYSINNKNLQGRIMINNNNTWEALIGGLINGTVVNYAFRFINESNYQYNTPWYTYTHYRA